MGTASSRGLLLKLQLDSTSVRASRFSVQIPANPNKKRQVNHSQPRQNPKREPSQVSREPGVGQPVHSQRNT